MPTPDPYLPGHGDTRYRVQHHDLRLDYKVATNRLDEVAAHGTPGFRGLIVPGSVLLWPALLLRLVRRTAT